MVHTRRGQDEPLGYPRKTMSRTETAWLSSIIWVLSIDTQSRHDKSYLKSIQEKSCYSLHVLTFLVWEGGCHNIVVHVDDDVCTRIGSYVWLLV